MKPKDIPQELLPFVGKLIRQARTARGLTIYQGAELTGLPRGQLENLEHAITSATTTHLMFILAAYGGVRSDAAEDLIFRWMREESRRVHQTESRKNLSLAGETDSRPWERMRYDSVICGAP